MVVKKYIVILLFLFLDSVSAGPVESIVDRFAKSNVADSILANSGLDPKSKEAELSKKILVNTMGSGNPKNVKKIIEEHHRGDKGYKFSNKFKPLKTKEKKDNVYKHKEKFNNAIELEKTKNVNNYKKAEKIYRSIIREGKNNNYYYLSIIRLIDLYYSGKIGELDEAIDLLKQYSNFKIDRDYIEYFAVYNILLFTRKLHSISSEDAYKWQKNYYKNTDGYYHVLLKDTVILDEMLSLFAGDIFKTLLKDKIDFARAYNPKSDSDIEFSLFFCTKRDDLKCLNKTINYILSSNSKNHIKHLIKILNNSENISEESLLYISLVFMFKELYPISMTIAKIYNNKYDNFYSKLIMAEIERRYHGVTSDKFYNSIASMMKNKKEIEQIISKFNNFDTQNSEELFVKNRIDLKNTAALEFINVYAKPKKWVGTKCSTLVFDLECIDNKWSIDSCLMLYKDLGEGCIYNFTHSKGLCDLDDRGIKCFNIINVDSDDTLNVRSDSHHKSDKVGEIPYNAKNIHVFRDYWNLDPDSSIKLKQKWVEIGYCNDGSAAPGPWCKGNYITGFVNSNYLVHPDANNESIFWVIK